ncbi:MAG: hypothetical protein D6820_18775, partial [Lentisphaerae bacterium]
MGNTPVTFTAQASEEDADIPARSINGDSPTIRALWLSAVLLLVFAHTQLSLRQIALRLAGLHYGEIHEVLSPLEYLERAPSELLKLPAANDPKAKGPQVYTVLRDRFGVFLNHRLAGTKIRVDRDEWKIVDNTATYLLIEASPQAIRKSGIVGKRYICGYRRLGLIQRLALRVPRFNLGCHDILLLFCVLLLGLQVYRDRQLSIRFLCSHRPPWSALFFTLAALLSLLPQLKSGLDMSPDWKGGIKELIQVLEFLAVFVVFTIFWRQARERSARWFLPVIATTALIVSLLAWLEFWVVVNGWTLRGVADAHTIDSTFGWRFNPDRAWATGSESSRKVLALY